jgi:hypothetical protein
MIIAMALPKRSARRNQECSDSRNCWSQGPKNVNVGSETRRKVDCDQEIETATPHNKQLECKNHLRKGERLRSTRKIVGKEEKRMKVGRGAEAVVTLTDSPSLLMRVS